MNRQIVEDEVPNKNVNVSLMNPNTKFVVTYDATANVTFPHFDLGQDNALGFIHSQHE